MMEKHISPARLTVLCAVVYLCSYLTRYNYSAVLVEIVASDGLTKTAAAASLTGMFITYGCGQLINGFLGDRIKPQLLMFVGLFASALMNFLIPLCTSALQMILVWGINGFAQSMLWPPLVKILVLFLTEQEYQKASFLVSCASSIGTILVYLLAPVCIAVAGWRLLFYITGGAAMLMAVVWLFEFRGVEIPQTVIDADEKRINTKQRLDGKCKLMLAFLLMAIVLQGLLRDGIGTWMPSILSDTFSLTSTVSILSGVALPIFAIIMFKFATWVNKHLITNEISTAAVFFGFGTLFLCAMWLFGEKYRMSAVILLTLANGAMHGVNLMLICMLPSRFRNLGCVSFISGILNTATYIGSALSSYGIAAITELYGWHTTLLIWTLLAAAGVMLCLLGHKLYDKI